MINTPAECRDTFRMLESRMREGADRYRLAMEGIRDLRRTGEIAGFSVRDMFEELVPDGREAVREMRSRRTLGVNLLMEAGGDAITTMHFSNIIGQISYADVLENMENGEFIGDQLVTQIAATTSQKEMIPGITMIGDQAQKVGENEDYPLVTIGEQFIVLPEIYKYGFVMAITEEAIAEDKTGQLFANFNQVSQAMAINLEKERLSVALGVTNTYSRNGGPTQNTYANSHTQWDFDNLVASNALTDYRNFEASMIAFQSVTDPDTGEPVMLGGPRALVVPQERLVRAYRAINATEVRTGALGNSDVQMIGGNPIAAMGANAGMSVLSNQYVGSVAGATTSWWLGNFKKAFVERVVYPTQVQVEDRNSTVGFERDVISRVKVRRKSVVGVKAPQYVQKNTE